MPRITPFLWFDNQAEEAAKFYVSIFKSSKIVEVARYREAGPGPKGTAMTVGFHLDGQDFTALKGGPAFKFNEAGDRGAREGRRLGLIGARRRRRAAPHPTP